MVTDKADENDKSTKHFKTSNFFIIANFYPFEKMYRVQKEMYIINNKKVEEMTIRKNLNNLIVNNNIIIQNE